MDFVEWCDRVLQKVIEAGRQAHTHRSIGVHENDIALLLFSQEVVELLEFRQSAQYMAMISALGQLQHMSLVERSPFWKVTKGGRDAVSDMLPLWFTICQETLDEEQQQLLKVMNRRGLQTTDGYTWLEKVTLETLLSELSWADDRDVLWATAQELQQWGYLTGQFYMGGAMNLYATYRSLVWETRRGFTLESRFIDNLIAEWDSV